MKISCEFGKLLAAAMVLCMLPTGCRNSAVNDIPQNTSGSSMPDKTKGPFLFVGTYTENESTSGRQSKGIYIYQMDTVTGSLSFISASPRTTNPSYLVIHPGKKLVYAVNETGGDGPDAFGAVTAFRLDQDSMRLQFINTVSSRGAYPCYISTDPSGKFALVANYGTGDVALFPIAADGSLAEASSVIQHKGKGPHKNQEGPHAHMILPGPGGKFIYGTDLGTDQVGVYLIDTVKRSLIETKLSAAAKAGAGPRHLVFHPEKPWMYVVNELNGSIEAYSMDIKSGSLKRFQAISSLPEGVNAEASCADIHITPSGRFLYASNRADQNSIAMFTINPVTGMLRLMGHQSTLGKTPRSFVIDPSGNFLLVANQNTGNIFSFRIGRETGMLTPTGIETKIPSPVCLKFY